MIDQKMIVCSIGAALEAGKAIMEVYLSNDFHVEKKSDSSPLTLADTRAHDVIVSHLRNFDIPILSEEGKNIPFEKRKAWNTLWIVDPLDGTKEFIKRNGEFTVNIALVQDENPVFGVVYAPERKILYYAEQEMGAYKVDHPDDVQRLLDTNKEGADSEKLQSIINISRKLPEKRPEKMPYTIVGSRSHMTPEVEAFVEKKRKEHGNVHFISAGSSLKLCLVAEGKADIYPRLGPTMEWDTAAGQAVAQGAGGGVLRHDTGKPLSYNKENLLNPWFIVER